MLIALMMTLSEIRRPPLGFTAYQSSFGIGYFIALPQ